DAVCQPCRLVGCHCVAANAGLRLPPWMAAMPVLQEQKPALCPNVRRGFSLQSSLARVPAVTRFARPSGQPAAVTPAGRCLAEKIRLSQRIVRHVLCHDPCPESSGHGYRLFSAAGWPEWAGKNRSNLNRFGGLRPEDFWVFGFCARSAPKKAMPA